jgi:hypothetical protein
MWAWKQLSKLANMHKGKWAILLICVIAILLTSCSPPTLIPPTPTDTPNPTETPTPTVVWFPPTPTKTTVPRSEPTATVEMQPGIGEIIFEDDFSSSGAWQLGTNTKGTIALGVDELTIAVVEPRAYLSSIRNEPTVGDFYAEITASPSLCAGLDEYGLLFRVRSQGDFYRFSLSCDGQIRLDRVVSGTGGSPQPWLISASVPRGAPSISRLGVWAVGKELRFFVNDEFQFAVSDSYHGSGLLGVFARSAGENAITVSFSDLKAYQIRQ